MILEDAFSQRKQRIFSNDTPTKNLVFTFEIYTNKINKAIYLESIDKLINRQRELLVQMSQIYSS